MDKCTLAALSTARGMARGHWEHPDQRGEDTRETHPTQSHHSAALIFSVIWALLTPAATGHRAAEGHLCCCGTVGSHLACPPTMFCSQEWRLTLGSPGLSLCRHSPRQPFLQPLLHRGQQLVWVSVCLGPTLCPILLLGDLPIAYMIIVIWLPPARNPHSDPAGSAGAIPSAHGECFVSCSGRTPAPHKPFLCSCA